MCMGLTWVRKALALTHGQATSPTSGPDSWPVRVAPRLTLESRVSRAAVVIGKIWSMERKKKKSPSTD